MRRNNTQPTSIRGAAVVTFVVGALVTAPCRAEPTDHVAEYRELTEYSILICSIRLKTELVQADTPSSPSAASAAELRDARQCVIDQRKEVQAKFKVVSRGVKKATATSALKNYQAIFLATLDGIFPGANERKIDYDQRQQAATMRLTEAWHRFSLE